MRNYSLVMILSIAFLYSGGGYDRPPAKVYRLCGYVQREVEIPRRNHPDTPKLVEKPVKKAQVLLYARTSSGSCCESAIPIAEATTKKSGKFEFKTVPAGNYWVVAIVDGRTYSMAVEYVLPKASFSDCNEFLYTIDRAGNFTMKATVTVT